MKIYIITGEASGDLLGSHLLPYLKAHTLKGIGGDLMKAQGFDSLFPQEDLSVMGIVEILPHLPRIYKRFRQTIDDIKRFEPDILLTIDSPGFCKRIIKRLKKEKQHMHFIHYVAPSVWAWRQKRAYTWSKLVDHMLCLFPFEPIYFEKHALKATFVGHPVSHWHLPKMSKQKQLLVLPGSRKREIKNLAKIFDEAASLYKKDHPDIKVIWFTLPHLKDMLQALVPNAFIICHDKERVFATSSLAIAASGTITLELAYANVPCVVGYKISKITASIIRKIIKIPYCSLLNILHQKHIVPECLQKECTPENIALHLKNLRPQPFPSALLNKNPGKEIAKILADITRSIIFTKK